MLLTLEYDWNFDSRLRLSAYILIREGQNYKLVNAIDFINFYKNFVLVY